MKPVRLLLINPRTPESFWSFKWAVDTMMPGKRAVNPPLGLATLAALCPSHWDVTIVDENIESVPLAPAADIIGVCGMAVQFPRQKELLSFFKDQGYFVVAGGSFASLCPERFEGVAHTVVAGEAEYIWKEFCRDFESGTPAALYHETGAVSLDDSPVPRFDLLRLDKYQTVTLQFSRGCPFRCEFCDIIVMFGRKPRTKSYEHVGKELDLLRSLGVHNVFFVDDNLIGNKPVAKGLLQFLTDYQREHDYRFHFGTEASLNLAQDDQLLRLFQQAGFGWVFIGIESPDEESLKETKKYQNTRGDLLAGVHKIYSYGLDIFAGFIIGFDNDTPEVFEKQFQFIMQSGIQGAMIGLLTAIPKTPLYERLEKAGRLLPSANSADNTKLGTNVIPKQMQYDEMVAGYRTLYGRLLSDRHIAERIKNKARSLTKPQYAIDPSVTNRLSVLARLLFRGVLTGGLSRIYHFFRSLPWLSPRALPLVVQDWIIGLAMRDYVERNFDHLKERESRLAQRYAGLMETAFARYLRQGVLEVSLKEASHAAANLTLFMKGRLDRRFFARATNHLEDVLRDTKSSVTLRISEFSDKQCQYLQRLLTRLARHGDRIYITVPQRLRHRLEIDSSIFNLVLEA